MTMLTSTDLVTGQTSDRPASQPHHYYICYTISPTHHIPSHDHPFLHHLIRCENLIQKRPSHLLLAILVNTWLILQPGGRGVTLSSHWIIPDWVCFTIFWNTFMSHKLQCNGCGRSFAILISTCEVLIWKIYQNFASRTYSAAVLSQLSALAWDQARAFR